MAIWSLLAFFAVAFVLRLAVASRSSKAADGWGGLARQYATDRRLDALKRRVLDRQVIALMPWPGPRGRGDQALGTKLLAAPEGLYIENHALVSRTTPRLLVPWSDVQLHQQRRLLWRESFVLRLGRSIAYLHVTREGFDEICRQNAGVGEAPTRDAEG